MKRRVSASPARTRPDSSAADSSARRLVVPIGDDPPAPGARAHRWRRRSRQECDNARRASGARRGPRVSTGWNVPAPTWSVTNAVAIPAAASYANVASSKCKPAVGAAAAPAWLRINGLIARRIRGFGGARDVRRQRHVAVTVEIIEERPGAFEPETEESSIALDDGRAAHRPATAACRRVAADGSREAGTSLRRRRARARAGAPPGRRSGAARWRRALITRVSLNTTRSRRVDEPRKIAEREVLEHSPIDMQKPAVDAAYSRRLRDQLGRKLVIEIGEPIAGHRLAPEDTRKTIEAAACRNGPSENTSTPMAWLSAPFTLTAQALCSAIFNSIVIKGEFWRRPLSCFLLTSSNGTWSDKMKRTTAMLAAAILMAASGASVGRDRLQQRRTKPVERQRDDGMDPGRGLHFLAVTTTIDRRPLLTIEFGDGYSGSIWHALYADAGGAPAPQPARRVCRPAPD